MTYMDQFDCPACGHRFYRATPEEWKRQLAKFLSLFCEMVTPSETGRLIRAGQHLGMWENRTTAYRRLQQIEIEGYITQPAYAWWNLTDKGIELGRQYNLKHPPEIIEGVNDPISIPGPTIGGRPDRLDMVRTPTPWQVFFMREFAKLPDQQLVGFNAVARWAKKEGWLGKGGTTAIRMLIGDGWLVWTGNDGNYLGLSDAAKSKLAREVDEGSLASDIPAVDRAPRVDD